MTDNRGHWTRQVPWGLVIAMVLIGVGESVAPGAEAEKPKKRSRWANKVDRPLPSPVARLHSCLTPCVRPAGSGQRPEGYRECRSNEGDRRGRSLPRVDHTPALFNPTTPLQVNKKLASGVLEDPDNLSPSPEPIYDSNVSPSSVDSAAVSCRRTSLSANHV